MLQYLQFLHPAGYAVVLFDFRAHGASGGWRTSFGLRETEDALSVLEWVRNDRRTRDLPLVLYGESMGAVVALMATARNKNVRAVLADSPFADWEGAVEGRLKSLFGATLAVYLRPGLLRIAERVLGVTSDDLSPLAVIADIAPRPIFLVQGTHDFFPPERHAQRLFAASVDHAEYWELDGVRHVRSVFVHADEYARRVLAFLNRAINDMNDDI